MNELNKFIDLAGEQWFETLNNILEKEGETDDPYLYNAFIDIFSAIRILLIDNEESQLLSIKETISDDSLYQKLISHVKSLSNASFRIQPLRDMAKNRPDTAQKLIRDIINNDTIREDPVFSESYRDYGLSEEKELLQIADVITTFAEFLVENAFTKSAMLNSTRRNLYLTKETDAFLVDLIDQNYREIQLRLIIKGLKQQ